jgi:hypothetical protein
MRQLAAACACLLLTAAACAGAAELVPTHDVAPVVQLAEHLSRLPTTPPFDRPLRLTSEVRGSEVSAVIEAFVERPFADVQAALADPVRWCAVLVLHINNTGCKVEPAAAGREGRCSGLHPSARGYSCKKPLDGAAGRGQGLSRHL